MDPLLSSKTSYKTTPNNDSLFAKTFPGLSFYSYFIWLVFNASRKAKRSQYDDDQWRKNSHGVIQYLERVGVCFEINGLDHLENLQPPYVIIANHMSTLETTVLPSILLPFTKITFIIKQSLLKYPVFRHILSSIHPIAVNRISPRKDMKTVMEEGLNRLKKNISVVVFPQTTRMLYLDPNQFNTIGIKLAQRANAPIVPVALKTNAWGNGKLLKDFGKIDPSKKVYFAFGEPIRIKDRGKEEHDAIIQFINGKLNEWKTEE